jgi:hypothetical protein
MGDNQAKWSQSSNLFLMLGLIVAAIILAIGMGNIKDKGESITVKGYAEMTLKSDLTVWNITINSRMLTLAASFEKLKDSKTRLVNYLIQNGITKEMISESSLSNFTLYNYSANGAETDVKGYNMTQSLIITSKDIAKIQELSLKINDLLAEGIDFNSNPPEFYVSDIGKYKVQMLGEALKDAQIRARSIAKSVGNDIGGIRYAKQGIFQITPLNSTEISDWGMNDVSAVEKSIKSVVDAAFYVK